MSIGVIAPAHHPTEPQHRRYKTNVGRHSPDTKRM